MVLEETIGMEETGLINRYFIVYCGECHNKCKWDVL